MRLLIFFKVNSLFFYFILAEVKIWIFAYTFKWFLSKMKKILAYFELKSKFLATQLTLM